MLKLSDWQHGTEIDAHEESDLKKMLHRLWPITLNSDYNTLQATNKSLIDCVSDHLHYIILL